MSASCRGYFFFSFAKSGWMDVHFVSQNSFSSTLELDSRALSVRIGTTSPSLCCVRAWPTAIVPIDCFKLNFGTAFTELLVASLRTCS